MMLAQLKPSPSVPAGGNSGAVAANAPGADVVASPDGAPVASPSAAAAAGETAAPATQAATPQVVTPFSNWLLIDAQAGQPIAHEATVADAAEGQDSSLELAVPADGAAAQPVAQDVAAMPAMTMMLTLPPGAALPLPQSMPVSLAAPANSANDAAVAPTTTATPGVAAAPQAVAAALPFGLTAQNAGSAERASSRPASPSAPLAASIAAPISLPGAAVAMPAPAPYAAMRAADSTLAAPAAQKTTVATANAAPAIGIDTIARGEAPLAAPTTLLGGANALAPQATSQIAPADVKLAGTPDNWQQPLRDALGERLQLQLGRNIDQAVIRLDPPQLGRIEIAIRHAGGALEVTISATHSEVRRQLNTISDSMRSDLAQRQFSDVAVTITAAPRSGGAAFADQQGRGRQQEPQHEEANVGRALAEAGNPASTFSLFGREYTA